MIQKLPSNMRTALKALAEEVSDSLYLVMRVYFEKPRTTVGWKGLINDPHMDGSFDVEAGLKIARNLLVELVSMGLPLATEALDPKQPGNTWAICFSWSAIGARTTRVADAPRDGIGPLHAGRLQKRHRR
ncbi:Phospho-2-dehydro-3-deoxyheptonate aldolase, Tyr-sensitive [Leclercia adecarboxylata]|uniref:3-deoxy-7-phosphoheptulonate synthase n=1 Tax=Leclercia adecarboxylata TaxID=83655 RepID=A0A4U9ID69_9ENTR|nr:Phospho-2-dehydro-3-deoxyheptonate aldolase, Tyr-sensitive [Leclercia adecarboxylata]